MGSTAEICEQGKASNVMRTREKVAIREEKRKTKKMKNKKTKN